MKIGANFFVKVNYSIEGKEAEGKCTGAHIKRANLNGTDKYLIGGGYFNKNGGSIVFKARDLKEAREIANNNIFIKNKIYSYELIILDSNIKIA